jgi:hypothetical protein
VASAGRSAGGLPGGRLARLAHRSGAAGGTAIESCSRSETGLPLDEVVNLDYLGRTGELDATLGEDRHQALTERLELLV